MDIEKYNRVKDKIFCHLFKESITHHMSLPAFDWIGHSCRMDTSPFVYARFEGMIRLVKQKYGIYNKAYDNQRCKMHKICFPWLHC